MVARPPTPRASAPLAGLAAIALALGSVACGDGAPAADAPRPVMVVQPEPAAGQVGVFPGEVRARREPELSFRLGGELVARHVEVGDRVVAGQVLAELDPRDARLRLDAARAGLAAAEAALEIASVDLQRQASLLERGLVSAAAHDAARNAHAAAAARRQQAAAELDISRNQAGYARLDATADGVILARRAEVGQVVAAGQPVSVLAEDGGREVLISVAEHRQQAFEPGTPVLVELWSRPGRRVPGQVRERAPAADGATRTHAVRIAFDADALEAGLGQSARVIANGGSDQSLLLPLQAVGAEDGDAFVWRFDGTRIHRQPVEVLAFAEDGARVRGPIAPGDWVVMGGVHLLRDGQAVRAVDRDNRPVVVAAD